MMVAGEKRNSTRVRLQMLRKTRQTYRYAHNHKMFFAYDLAEELLELYT
jgi:hypothetical protein